MGEQNLLKSTMKAKHGPSWGILGTKSCEPRKKTCHEILKILVGFDGS